MILEWLPTAKQDFEDIIEYIAADNPSAAIEQGDEIEEQTSLLTSYPKIGRPGRVKGTRELVIVRTPYIAAYRIKGKTIQILRVLHGAQQWPMRWINQLTQDPLLSLNSKSHVPPLLTDVGGSSVD